MPTATVNGVALYWESTGGNDAPNGPLVLVHGSWNDHHSWDAVVPTLARSFRVITYDRRGHSQSERPTTPGSLAEDAADLAGLITSLGVAPAHVAGTSFGGAIALRLACERPDLFRSVAAHEPPLFGLLANHPETRAPLTAVQERIAVVAERLKAGDMEAGAREFMESIALGPGEWDRLPAQVQRTFVFNAPTFLDELLDPDGAIIDVRALSTFPHPALLTRGTLSPPFFPAVVAVLAGALSHAEEYAFAGAGHVPQRSHPDIYVEKLTEFASRVTSHRT